MRTTTRFRFLISLVCLLLMAGPAVLAQGGAATIQRERQKKYYPQSILNANSDLSRDDLSAEAVQLADQLDLAKPLAKVQELRQQINGQSGEVTLARLALRQDLCDLREDVSERIQQAGLEVDFALSAIHDEEALTSELLYTYATDRDKKCLEINAISFITNGALWALCEALSMPTYKYPHLSVSSGATGIFAGIIPSVGSMYALKVLSGDKYSAHSDPNMLCKLFDYPTLPSIDFPKSVWQFMISIPPGGAVSRRDQLISRWIADRNLGSYTGALTKRQLDLITGSAEQHKTITIDLLNARQNMLQQLGSEIYKMKRLLLELTLVLRDNKHIKTEG